MKKKIICIVVILATVFALIVPTFASAGTSTERQDMWVNCADGKRLNLRTDPSTGSKRVTQLECGTMVEILGNAGNGWLYVTDGRHTGYVMSKFLVDRKPGKFEITEREDNFVKVTPYMVSAKAMNGKSDKSVGLRVKPNKTARAIRRLTAGDTLEVIAKGKVWSKVIDQVTGQTGYVANQYIEAL